MIAPVKYLATTLRLTPNQSMAVEDYNGNFVNMTIKAGSKKKFDNVLTKLGQNNLWSRIWIFIQPIPLESSPLKSRTTVYLKKFFMSTTYYCLCSLIATHSKILAIDKIRLSDLVCESFDLTQFLLFEYVVKWLLNCKCK